MNYGTAFEGIPHWQYWMIFSFFALGIICYGDYIISLYKKKHKNIIEKARDVF